MKSKVYNLMDWAAVEEIVYAESVHPEEILGSHNQGKNSLVQCFYPGAKKVTLLIEGDDEKGRGKLVKEEIVMEEMDEAGFFAQILPGKDRHDYIYKVEYKEKSIKTAKYKEVYSGVHVLGRDEAEAINAGGDYAPYNKLGAHVMNHGKVRGCGFAVWAPNALRVSVVGDFNNWDSSINNMILIDGTGIFELFVPDIDEGCEYKFEILVKGGNKLIKTDPYAFEISKDASRNAVVSSVKGFKWKDADWIKARKSYKLKTAPVNIYEVNLSALCDSEKNIKKLTKEILSVLKSGHYTHVLLLPFAEFLDEDSCGFDTTNYYAPAGKYGDAADYMYFINEMHMSGIGVIMQWNANSFNNSEYGLGSFDGTALYEHEDPRKGVDPRNSKLLFNYMRPEVREYLIGNAMYWIDNYHIDGIEFTDVTGMLYLDYYRQPGEWIPNMYGGNENLDSIDFLRCINNVIHKEAKGVITIAVEESGYSHSTVTDDASKDEIDRSLGFDLVINSGFISDGMNYMSQDPIARQACHNDITMCGNYMYNEDYLVGIGFEDIAAGDIAARMFGQGKLGIDNYKAFLGYIMTFPGKKHMLMGQDVMRNLSDSDNANDSFNCYVQDLNDFYKRNECLYVNDFSVKGFEWINNYSANENVISFIRKGKTKEDFLVIVINFSNVIRSKYRIGVPYTGKYKECFTSALEIYGGEGSVNPRASLSRKSECDGRDSSIRLNLAPLSVTVMSYSPYTEKELLEIEKREKARSERKAKREQNMLRRAVDKAKMHAQLAKEKSRIKETLKQELERKVQAAEEKIAGGSENR